MREGQELKFSNKQIVSSEMKIPTADFADKSYDSEFFGKSKGVLIILSTPRSGSTLLCDLLYKSGFCLAHEYFQPHEYLPILANRWGCLDNGVLNKEKYVNQLAKFRTLNSGWLGINLHGHHLPAFNKFSECFSNSEKVFLRIRRRNVIAQAVSYEIASQTKRWSSEFQAKAKPTYSFNQIKKKLNSINHQNLITDTFLSLNNMVSTDIYYEDFIGNPGEVLGDILSDYIHKEPATASFLKKQSSNINEEWIERFSQELFTEASKEPSLIEKTFSLLKKTF